MTNLLVKIETSKKAFAIQQTLYTGLCKPEGLKHKLTGKWSPKINKKNRLIDTIDWVNESIKKPLFKGAL